MDFDSRLRKFAIELFKIDGIKFGEFIMKVSLFSPIYCDLRVLVSHPKLMDNLAQLIIDYLVKNDIKSYDVVCGVPYTALPIAAVLSVKSGTPMVLKRQEKKEHGTKQMVEGQFKKGNRCLIIEDVVTSGSSILETVQVLKGVGLECTDAIVLLNREQGGEQLLQNGSIKMYALLTMTQLLTFLKEDGLLEEERFLEITDYFKNTKVVQKATINRLKMHYSERISYSENLVCKKLLKIISDKQTNLCVAADLTTTRELLDLAEEIGPYICLFKMHIDILEDFNINFIKQLKFISERHNFLLFEDRKFADIGKVVELQYSSGLFRISSWADLITAHTITGNGVLDAIKITNNERGVFLLAETSASNNLINDTYVSGTLDLTDKYSDLIAGFVCQSPLFLDKPGFIQLTPGVRLSVSCDNLGQQYNSPECVVTKMGADVAVVGRGITQAPNKAVAAQNYKKMLWEAYLERIRS